MNQEKILEAASLLDVARLEAKEVERLTLTHPHLTLSEAYMIQDAGISLRTKRSERIIGYKMGLTSKAKQEQMNLRSPIYGVLTDLMEVKESQCLSLKGMIHPKIEPEIAFFVENEIRAPITCKEALAACSGVCAALEILDSRYLGFKYFSLPDVVADNSSSALFVLSSKVKNPSEVDLSHLEMVMSANGKVVERGSTNAISSHPGNSLVQLCELLGKRGLSIPARSIILAGAATQAMPLKTGIKVELDVEHLGDVSITVT